MAIYRFEAKVISRGNGRSTAAAASYRSGRFANNGKSAVSAAAYRAGAKLVDSRTGTSYDYSDKKGVLGAEIMVPDGTLPFLRDRQQLWEAVERIERRKDSQLAHDFILTLPHEMTQAQRVALTREFVRNEFCAKGFIADIAWHVPGKRGDDRNYHAHVMVPMRAIQDGALAPKKQRPTGSEHPAKAWAAELLNLRIAWANNANRHLEAAGLDIRIDHRSLSARGIDREPESKIGPVAGAMERRGRMSLAGNDNRDIRARNAARAALKTELAAAAAEEARILDLMAHRMRREKMASPTDEEMRQQPELEAERLRELAARDAGLQAFKTQKEHEAEEVKRKRQENAQAENRGGQEDNMPGRMQSGKMGSLNDEEIRQQPEREAERLRELAAQDARIQAFKKQTENEAEEAKRKKEENAQAENRGDRQDGMADARLRYAYALADHYDVRNPYGSLARAAMAEYGAFLKQQEQMKVEIAKEADPGKRRVAELHKEAHANEYMAITSERLAGISATIAGREDAPQAKLDRARAAAYAERGAALRQERRELMATQERQKQRERQSGMPQPGQPAEPGSRAAQARSDEQKKQDDRASANIKAGIGNRREADGELSDAKREQLEKFGATREAYAAHAAQRQQSRERGGGRSR